MKHVFTLQDPYEEYLKEDPYIDFSNPSILKLAQKLKDASESEEDLIRKTFEFVRDKISHSRDANREETPAKASDVLKEDTGLCWAKSNLLAALLRANKIPCAICYQRLPWNHNTSHCIHALNAVFFKNEWIRIDARGNRAGSVNARFTPPKEKLAFIADPQMGSKDFWILYAHPSAKLMHLLENSKNLDEVIKKMPDCYE